MEIIGKKSITCPEYLRDHSEEQNLPGYPQNEKNTMKDGTLTCLQIIGAVEIYNTPLMSERHITDNFILIHYGCLK